MNITYEDFIGAVKENDGETLPTVGGRKTFRLNQTASGVSFTPTSSGKVRQLNRASVQGYLDDFNRSQSTKTTDYVEDHRNQSYVLTIIRLILGQRLDAPEIDDGTGVSTEIDSEFDAPEGKEKVRSHRTRERSRELVRLAKAVFRQKHNRLFCEVCGFDFGRVYGELEFIEVHHLIPLCDLKPGHKTKLSELAMVCPNCHRMLHRGNPWPTMEGLRARMRSSRRHHQ